jgi:hypothetical protein
MTTLEGIGVVAGLGLAGGVGKAIIGATDVVLPCTEDTGHGKVWHPGLVGTLLAGVLAALLSWLLYGPVANMTIIGGTHRPNDIGLSAAEIAGALLVGYAGAQWLNAESDKRLAQHAAEGAKDAAAILATKPPDPALAGQIAGASPRETLNLATAD